METPATTQEKGVSEHIMKLTQQHVEKADALKEQIAVYHADIMYMRGRGVGTTDIHNALKEAHGVDFDYHALFDYIINFGREERIRFAQS